MYEVMLRILLISNNFEIRIKIKDELIIHAEFLKTEPNFGDRDRTLLCRGLSQRWWMPHLSLE
jgi:hypothetical protein